MRKIWPTLGATACALATAAALGGCRDKDVPTAPAPAPQLSIGPAPEFSIGPEKAPVPTRGGDKVPPVAPRPVPTVTDTEVTLFPTLLPEPSESPTEPTAPSEERSGPAPAPDGYR